MKEEEKIENLEDTDNDKNNEQNQDNSRDSSSKSTLNNVANNVLNNKYRSRKNADNSNDINANTTEVNKPMKNMTANNVRNRFATGVKNQIANKALNGVSNLHPALKALNVLNNIRNAKNASKSVQANAKGEGSEIADNSDNISNNGSSTDARNTFKEDNNSDNNEQSSLNPLRSIFSSKSGILGKFSFLGKISLPMKIAMMCGFVFSSFFLLILIISIPVGIFSSFFGMNEVEASESSSGNIDYGDYELSSDGDEILHESLDSFLSSQGTSLEDFNSLIASNVENAGYGTDAGVVAAAVTLIAELGNNYNVRIPYFWGGGHGQMITGADGNWGSNQCQASANGRIYNYCGLDCSGFIAWAIYNGGFKIAARSAGAFQNLPGAQRVSLTESAVLKPGDLIESGAHIVLVVGIDEDTNEYICAEASGYGSGVKFSRRPFNRRGYWGVKMSGFYERQVRS